MENGYKKINESNMRNAKSVKTDPRPYSDSRCYRKEKPSLILGDPSAKFAVHKYKANE